MLVGNPANILGTLQRRANSLEQPCELCCAEIRQERGDRRVLIARSREVVGEPATGQTRRDLGVHLGGTAYGGDEGTFM